jgi:hypothetical protein
MRPRCCFHLKIIDGEDNKIYRGSERPLRNKIMPKPSAEAICSPSPTQMITTGWDIFGNTVGPLATPDRHWPKSKTNSHLIIFATQPLLAQVGIRGNLVSVTFFQRKN